MRVVTCDRCHHAEGQPYGKIDEVAVNHWPIDSEGDVSELLPNMDLCGKCRNDLRRALKSFLGETAVNRKTA